MNCHLATYLCYISLSSFCLHRSRSSGVIYRKDVCILMTFRKIKFIRCGKILIAKAEVFLISVLSSIAYRRTSSRLVDKWNKRHLNPMDKVREQGVLLAPGEMARKIEKIIWCDIKKNFQLKTLLLRTKTLCPPLIADTAFSNLKSKHRLIINGSSLIFFFFFFFFFCASCSLLLCLFFFS